VDLTEEVFVILAAVVLLALARWVQQWLYGKTLHALLTEDDNPAMGIAIAGYLFGVFWAVTALLGNLKDPAHHYELLPDLWNVLLYGVVGIVLLTAVALGTCRVFLGTGIQEQLAARNVAAAIVVAGVYIATGLTYSGTLSGEGGSFGILLLFFLLGQLALLGIGGRGNDRVAVHVPREVAVDHLNRPLIPDERVGDGRRVAAAGGPALAGALPQRVIKPRGFRVVVDRPRVADDLVSGPVARRRIVLAEGGDITGGSRIGDRLQVLGAHRAQ